MFDIQSAPVVQRLLPPQRKEGLRSIVDRLAARIEPSERYGNRYKNYSYCSRDIYFEKYYGCGMAVGEKMKNDYLGGKMKKM